MRVLPSRLCEIGGERGAVAREHLGLGEQRDAPFFSRRGERGAERPAELAGGVEVGGHAARRRLLPCWTTVRAVDDSLIVKLER